MKEFSVTVPCKTYIRKYFTTIYGPQIQLDHKTDFGDTILTKLSHRPLIRISRQHLNIAFRDYNDQLKFVIPVYFFYYTEHNLNEQNIFNINRYLQNTFESDLFTMMNIAAAFGVERKTACETFAKNHNISVEEDITLDAMLRAERRSRTAKTMANFFLVNLSAKVQAPHRQ